MAYLNPDSTSTVGGVKVNEYLLTKHNPNKIDMPTASMKGKVIGVTVHNTDWITVNAATTPAEQYTRATVNGNMKDVRVHYYVDDVCAWQNLPLDLSGWHAADGSGNGNRRTIAIECIMSYAYNSKDKKSEDNCARLVAALLKQLGLGIDRLYTHTHWLNVREGKTGNVDTLNTTKNAYKNCPAYILPHWAAFKAKVAGYLGTSSASNSQSTNSSVNSSTSFAVGSTVFVKAGAVDVNGKTASAIYAGANNSLVVRSVSNNVYTLYKGDVPVYRMNGKYLSASYQGTSSDVLTPGTSRVKVQAGSVWWGTNTNPPAWVLSSTFYLQQLDPVTGRAVIGTTPRSTSTTTTGAIDVKYLKKA